MDEPKEIYGGEKELLERIEAAKTIVDLQKRLIIKDKK